MGGQESKTAQPKSDPLADRRNQALEAARGLEKKGSTQVNAAVRAREAAANLDAQSAVARQQLARLQAERHLEGAAEREARLAAQARADEILRARMERSQPSPEVEAARISQTRQLEEGRRRAIQVANQHEIEAKLEQAQPSLTPSLTPLLPSTPEKEMERELAKQRDNLVAPLAVTLTPEDLAPEQLQQPVSVTPVVNHFAANEAARMAEAEKAELAAETRRVGALLRESQQAAPRHPAPFSPVARRTHQDVEQLHKDIQKSLSNPVMVKLLLLFFVGPPVLFFAIIIVAFVVQTLTGTLRSGGSKSNSSNQAQALPEASRSKVKPAFAYTREMAEKRILQGHEVVGKDEWGRPLLQLGNKRQDVYSHYLSLIRTRTNTIDQMPEDFFRLGLMQEFACFTSAGGQPLYSLATAAFQTAAIYGHEEALSRYWSLFERGHDPQRVYNPRETARSYMRNRDSSWRDPTE